MAIGDYLIEGVFDPAAVFAGDDERGQEFHRMARVSPDLSQNPVLFAEGDGDQLTEEPRAYGLQQTPSRLQFEGSGSPEFDPDHETLAANVADHLKAQGHCLERGE